MEEEICIGQATEAEEQSNPGCTRLEAYKIMFSHERPLIHTEHVACTFSAKMALAVADSEGFPAKLYDLDMGDIAGHVYVVLDEQGPEEPALNQIHWPEGVNVDEEFRSVSVGTVRESGLDITDDIRARLIEEVY